MNDQQNNSPKRDVEIFTEALELSVPERSAYLDRACGGDAELRRKVEVLLARQEEVGDFLEQSAQTISPQNKAGAFVGEKPGDRIGHYKLLQQIGEGGGGVVFMAEQEEPVRRRVALKIIKPGMDTKNVIARFEAERQALALMDHPSIAKVFDAGATTSGRPYFVMELIRGIKITDYCDQHALPTEERLKLFIQVCHAVQHAHQKGIIHRDIKPSNILVTQNEEGEPLPVVIDFGIAKATTNQQLTDKTLFTAFEMLIGTPAYMSPEQAALTIVDVDTRTDVYSLGVLLYELLTGSTPFDTAELLKSGLDEVRRVIREQEPVRPSTRLSKLTAADLTTVAQRRHSEPPMLIRAVHGDLDWIVMKAIEKDRTRRYETANSLALDIQRFLTDEAISARPPSKFYRFQKVAQRNKLLFAAVGSIAILIVVSLIVVSAALAKERRSRRQAEAASMKSKEVTAFLEEMLQGVGPSVALGEDTKMLRRILDQTAERVSRDMGNQPLVEAELRNIIGKLYEELGHADKGEENVRKALEIYRRQLGPDSLEVAAAWNLLGLQLAPQSKLSEAKQAFSEALEIRRRRLGDEHPDTATSLNDLGAVHRDLGKFAEAETMTREALRIRLKISGANTNNLAVADSLRNLCMVMGEQSRWGDAEATAREVLAMRRKVLPPEHPLIASALGDLAWAANGNGKFEEAQTFQAEALLMKHKLLGDSHPDVPYALNSLGKVLGTLGDRPASEAVLKAVLSIQRKMFGEDGEATFETIYSLAQVLNAQGKRSESESVWRELLALWNKRGGDANPQRLYAVRGFAETLEEDGKWAEAESLWRESLRFWREREGVEGQQSMYTLRKLGLTLEAQRKWPEAEAVHREALELSRKKGDTGAEALVDFERVVRVLTAEGKFAEAEKLLGEILTPEFASQPAGLNLLIARVNLKGRTGRWQEAVDDVGLLLKLQPSEHYHYHRLAALLAMSQNRPAYRELCQKILVTYTNTANPYVDERLAQDCLLLPDSNVDLPSVDRFADMAVTLGKDENESALAYFRGSKAMASYRLGHFDDAIEWATKAAKSPAAEAQSKAKAFAVLALANWQLGKKDDARAALLQGDTLAPALLPSGDLGDSWVAWLIARVSLDEAAALIQSERATTSPPVAK